MSAQADGEQSKNKNKIGGEAVTSVDYIIVEDYYILETLQKKKLSTCNAHHLKGHGNNTESSWLYRYIAVVLTILNCRHNHVSGLHVHPPR
jgi:hypothetical protein